MLAEPHKKFCRIQHLEIYLLDLKVQYKHKIKLPLDMVSKHVFLYLCFPDYDVTPYILMHTRRRRLRVRDNPFRLDVRNRILLVIIWLRMYSEVAVLSGLFMICPSSVEREIRFLLPVLWNYFKEFVRWPTAEQWLEMANHWQMFPGAVAVIDGTRHRIQRPQIEPQQNFYSGHTRYHNFST